MPRAQFGKELMIMLHENSMSFPEFIDSVSLWRPGIIWIVIAQTNVERRLFGDSQHAIEETLHCQIWQHWDLIPNVGTDDPSAMRNRTPVNHRTVADDDTPVHRIAKGHYVLGELDPIVALMTGKIRVEVTSNDPDAP